jgi:hypothetical protein
VQIVFGDGTFWQWRQEDYEKTKHRTELSEKLNSSIAQALQLEREQIEACFRKETRGSEISYQALYDSEKAETGCYQKEYPSMGEVVPLCFLQATMPETVLSFIWTLFLSA